MSQFKAPLQTWNERFAAEGYLFGLEPNGYLKSCERFLPKTGNALCIADGEGRNSVWMAQMGLAVDAFDFSPLAINKAKTLAQEKHVEVNFACSDWQSFDWKKQHYDVVAGIFFQFVEPENFKTLMGRLDHALKPGGVLIVQGYGKDQLKFNTGGPGKASHLYDEAMLLACFHGYEVEEIKTYEAEINEGTAHCGQSSLVGLVARKP